MFIVVIEEKVFSARSLDTPAMNAVARQKGQWEEDHRIQTLVVMDKCLGFITSGQSILIICKTRTLYVQMFRPLRSHALNLQQVKI